MPAYNGSRESSIVHYELVSEAVVSGDIAQVGGVLDTFLEHLGHRMEALYAVWLTEDNALTGEDFDPLAAVVGRYVPELIRSDMEHWSTTLENKYSSHRLIAEYTRVRKRVLAAQDAYFRDLVHPVVDAVLSWIVLGADVSPGSPELGHEEGQIEPWRIARTRAALYEYLGVFVLPPKNVLLSLLHGPAGYALGTVAGEGLRILRAERTPGVELLQDPDKKSLARGRRVGAYSDPWEYERRRIAMDKSLRYGERQQRLANLEASVRSARADYRYSFKGAHRVGQVSGGLFSAIVLGALQIDVAKSRGQPVADRTARQFYRSIQHLSPNISDSLSFTDPREELGRAYLDLSEFLLSLETLPNRLLQDYQFYELAQDGSPSAQGIVVTFKNGARYYWDREVIGEEHLRMMGALAEGGSGLNRYIKRKSTGIADAFSFQVWDSWSFESLDKAWVRPFKEPKKRRRIIGGFDLFVGDAD